METFWWPKRRKRGRVDSDVSSHSDEASLNLVCVHVLVSTLCCGVLSRTEASPNLWVLDVVCVMLFLCLVLNWSSLLCSQFLRL